MTHTDLTIPATYLLTPEQYDMISQALATTYNPAWMPENMKKEVEIIRKKLAIVTKD